MRLNGHNLKPQVRFFGKDSYHLGVELEVEAPNYDAQTSGLGLSRSPRYCYAKHDGSLADTGWELVTHPISRRYWLDQTGKRHCVQNFFKLVNGLRDLGYTSHSNSRCGLHIHVSLTAFNGVKVDPVTNRPVCNVSTRSGLCLPNQRVHLYWFSRLVNSELFRKISQRSRDTINQWARIVNVQARDFSRIGQGSRYMATNMTQSTVEVRIFRGNMRPDRIRKNLESVVAAIEFTRPLRAIDVKNCGFGDADLHKRFCVYVASDKATYPNLHNFLIEIGLTKEDSK